ncbi:MAG: histone methyltransferase set2 [Piccolia ochrophora]|nr:MAG: histone methyltransferase set2 [Piccolia ochrophora]
MIDDKQEVKSEPVERSLGEMGLQSSSSNSSIEDALDTIRVGEVKQSPVTTPADDHSPREELTKPSSPSSPHAKSATPSPKSENDPHEEIIGGDVTIKLEPGKAPKLSRSSSRKIVARPPPLFDHLPNRTKDATAAFQVIGDCIYSTKHTGSSDQEALGCECGEEWDGSTNIACGDDSDCINRLTKIECVDAECSCGSTCQNQRFQLKQWAKVSVIETDKKGFGLRADVDLPAHSFIFEYIGDVINEANFRRRMVNYDEEGIKHFYFMSLTNGVFVDATKRGNLGRFCNHSCNPNCYVDKWVVGEKLRMGIFTERRVMAGEELVFNYNVDRYGADPQPCYCGEPNCTGFLGGKTQTERATKLPLQTLEALGIDDGDGWDTAIAKRPRKKKTGEDDEEYVDSVEPKSLDEDAVNKVMATLMQCKEKWIVVKLLSRLQRCDNERVRNRVVKMHGYQILNATLTTWKDDFNIALQILDILDMFPRLTRNKIADSKIEGTVESLRLCEDERVRDGASALLKEWSTLETGYRIPRRKREANTAGGAERTDRFERRESAREERKEKSQSLSRSHSPDAPKGSLGPSNSRINASSRTNGYYPAPRPPAPRRVPLPHGWFAAQHGDRVYYYSASGERTWVRPTQPAPQPPPPPKQMTRDQNLQMIIDSITKEKPKAKTPVVETPEPSKAPRDKKQSQEKWRSYSEDKRKKLYENTLFPHIKYVMDKFKSKLPRDDLKRFGKEMAKKLVNSDFKNKRVEDPTRISPRQEKQVKKFVKDYFDKAVAKKRDHDKKKAESKSRHGESSSASHAGPEKNKDEEIQEPDGDPMLELSDMEDEGVDLNVSQPPTPGLDNVYGDSLKRKREDDEQYTPTLEEGTPNKRLRSTTPTPPPPPPPPPALELLDEQPPMNLSEVEMNGSADRVGDCPSPSLAAMNNEWPRTPGQLDDAGGHSDTNEYEQAPRSSSQGSPNDAPNHFEGMNHERVRQLGLTTGM